MPKRGLNSVEPGLSKGRDLLFSHEGNGTRLTVVDEAATDEQREALVALTSGQHGGVGFEIFASVCPNERESVVASIGLESDRERRMARIRIPGIAEMQIGADPQPCHR